MFVGSSLSANIIITFKMALISQCQPPQFVAPGSSRNLSAWEQVYTNSRHSTESYEQKASDLNLSSAEFKRFVDLGELSDLVHRIEMRKPLLKPKDIVAMSDHRVAELLRSSFYHQMGNGAIHARFVELAAVLKHLAAQFDTLPLSKSSNQASRPKESKHVTTASVFEVLDNFSLFPKLPPELRQRIWFHALPGTRVLELYRRGMGDYEPVTMSKAAHLSLLNIFSVCSESRAIVLMHYTPVLLRRMGFREMSRGQTILVNHEQDIFYFHYEDWWSWGRYTGIDGRLVVDGAAQINKFKSIALPLSICNSFLDDVRGLDRRRSWLL